MKWVHWLAMALLLTGCHRSYLSCRSEYLYPTHLASQKVNTPDPDKGCFYGQQIIVHWDLPKNCLIRPVELHLHIRYGNREIEQVSHTLEKGRGWFIHRVVNRDYWCQEGILSFYAELLQDGEVLDDWTHYLWVPIISTGL